MLSQLLLLPVLGTQATFTIDLSTTRPISPFIYGANFPDWARMKTPFTLSRQGGNRMSAYNWENNASNAGSDWRHQSDGYMGETDEPGWTQRTFMEAAHKNGAAVLLTIPTLGYVSADKAPEGDVANTPNYLETRFNRSLASKPGGRYAYPPNTKDKAVYQDEFAHWIVRKAAGRPVWFSLDNEPDIWAHTHARLVPKPLGYAEIIANNIAFASALKKVAPKSLIFGPANYGWQGFRTFQGAADAAGRDFLDVYLAALRDAERKHGRRLLDVLDIHWYPEARGADIRISTTDGTKDPAEAHEARVQASRSLWDPTYVEKSWIIDTLQGKPITLLPRVLGQIAKHYPGTRLAITEYDYGGGKTPSGLVAQADVLGLFGRYGLFAAAHWGIGPDDRAQIAAFRAYLNFDGKGARFGSRSVRVGGERPASNALHAATDGKGRLTVVAINKLSSEQAMRIDTGRFGARRVRAFLAHHDRPFQPSPVAASLKGGTIEVKVPPLGVVTLEATR